MRDVAQLPWEDMEDIGIVKLGHQKKLLLAIKRIKDILSGKWIAPGSANSPQVSTTGTNKMASALKREELIFEKKTQIKIGLLGEFTTAQLGPSATVL